ncbi:MAG: lipoprotein [bacterium]
MRKIILIILYALVLASCSDKIKDINLDESVEISDFIESFPALKLPIQYGQKELLKKEKDSLFIKSSVVAKFIPDSIFKKPFGKTETIKFHRKGRYAAEETGEIYLFLTAEKKDKKAIYIIVFTKEEIYSTSMSFVEKSTDPLITFDGKIDTRLTIIQTKNKATSEGKSTYNKNVYVYNTEGLFTLILTESNEPLKPNVIYNPIDTLQAKEPLSGNYTKDKRNFVSIRDGGKKGKLLFFIHTDKGGSCGGSLRGDIVEVRPKVYQYNKSDDHCVLEFTFSGRNLKVQELQACGNHRGVRCSFDGRFRK